MHVFEEKQIKPWASKVIGKITVCSCFCAFLFLVVFLGTGFGISKGDIYQVVDTNKPMKLLMTGWGPFLNFTTNPSELVAEYFRDKCFEEEGFQWCVEAHVLPVNRTGVMQIVELLEARSRGQSDPTSRDLGVDAILHLGLENVAKGLKMEIAAANFQANDTGGPPVGPAVPNGPSLEAVTADLGVMRTIGTEDMWSRDAGEYYCNELLYRSLEWIRRKNATQEQSGQLLGAMFVHVPNTTVDTIARDSQVIRTIAGRLLEGSARPQKFSFHMSASGILILVGIVASTYGLLVTIALCCCFENVRKKEHIAAIESEESIHYKPMEEYN